MDVGEEHRVEVVGRAPLVGEPQHRPAAGVELQAPVAVPDEHAGARPPGAGVGHPGAGERDAGDRVIGSSTHQTHRLRIVPMPSIHDSSTSPARRNRAGWRAMPDARRGCR